MTTYVLVHGICHGAWCWERTRSDLAALGHEVVAVDLALTGLDDDASIVIEALDGVSGPAVLVGHSYGGLVISRAAQGRDDVAHLVYVAAVMLDGDDVFAARTTEFPLTELGGRATISDDRIITVNHDAALAGFFNECDADVAEAAASRLRPTALTCLTTPSGSEPWREIPSTYILCERDEAIHPDFQRVMAQHAARTVTFDTDHSPFLSRPEQLLAVLLESGQDET